MSPYKVESIKTLFTLTFMYKEGKKVLLTLCNISIDKGTDSAYWMVIEKINNDRGDSFCEENNR